jgi:hypothetical protein
MPLHTTAKQKKLKAVSLAVAKRMKGFREELDRFEKDIIAGFGEEVSKADRLYHVDWHDLSEDEKAAIGEKLLNRVVNYIFTKGVPWVVETMDQGLCSDITRPGNGLNLSVNVTILGEDIKILLIELERSKEEKEA